MLVQYFVTTSEVSCNIMSVEIWNMTDGESAGLFSVSGILLVNLY